MAKLTSLRDAVASLVRDGDCVYAAGFTHLIPFAAGHEIIRQKRKDLVLARATPDLIYDQMIAGGCAAQGDLLVRRQSRRGPAQGACAPRSRPGGWNGKSTRTSA